MPSRESDHWQPIFLGLIVFVGAALRLWGLSELPFEQDELYTVRDAVDFGASSSGPGISGRPLYYLLQHLLLRVFPETPFWIRFPAFAFGVLGIWLTGLVGKRQFGPTAGVLAAFAVAVSPWHLYASQFARYWTLVYAAAALMVLTYLRAVESDRPRDFLWTFGAVLIGTLTHPTFLFGAAGLVFGARFGLTEGRRRFRLPSRGEWTFLWIPFAAMLGAAVLALTLFRETSGVTNLGSRGFVAGARLVPAIVQWVGLPLATAAAATGVWLLIRGDTDRGWRWAWISLAVPGTVTALLLAASFRTGVYADYGMSALPVLLVTAAAGAALVVERLARDEMLGSLAAMVVLGSFVAASTLSHLSDGTRFEYRPLLNYAQAAGGDRLLMGWPTVVIRKYAPAQPYTEIQMSTEFLDQTKKASRGFWLLSSHRRYGLVGDDGRIWHWIQRNCEFIASQENPRLDYRVYRAELHWCGSTPPPTLESEPLPDGAAPNDSG